MTSFNGLDVNVSKVEKDLDGRFGCQQCGKSFASREGLKVHINGVHLNVKPFKCQQCSFRGATSANIKRHWISVHQSAREHRCELCEKTFSLFQGLKRHVESVHEKLDKYKCGECEKSFTLPYSLKRHLVSVHRQGDKQFPCDVCGKGFSLRDALKRHRERVHCTTKQSSSASNAVRRNRTDHVPPAVKVDQSSPQSVQIQPQQHFVYGNVSTSRPVFPTTSDLRPLMGLAAAAATNPRFEFKPPIATTMMPAPHAALINQIRQPIWPS